MYTVSIFDSPIKLNFYGTTPSEKKKIERINFIEEYFTPTGGRIVLNRNEGKYSVERFEMTTYNDKPHPAWLSALKVISYMTIIIPFVFAVMRIVHLRSFGFKIKAIPSVNEVFLTRLATALDDIERARVLVRAYEKHIEKSLFLWDRISFQHYLFCYCAYIGSEQFDEKDLLLEALEKWNKKAFAKDGFKTKYEAFVQEVKANSVIEATPSTTSSTDKKTVAVLYTGLGGGGHKAPAFALAKSLTEKGYRVELIDTDNIAKDFEPKVDGKYGYEDIWTEFYQRREQPFMTYFMWFRHALAYSPECRRTNEIVLKNLKKINPDLIFTVAHHKPKLAYCALRLNKKMIYVQTDNRFCGALEKIAREQIKFSSPLIKITKPETAPEETYFETFGSLLPNNKKPPALLSIIEQVKKNLLPLQIPVRFSFKRVTPTEQQVIKSKLNIEPNVKVCMVMMGNNGVEKKARAIFDKLLKEKAKAKERLHVIFICGNNKSLADEFNKRINEFQGSPISVEAKEYLQESEMAEIAQASDVWIAKMGGSTSAEALQMKKQVLSVSIKWHPWEDINAKANHDLGLADKFDEQADVIPQIEDACSKTETDRSIPDWQEQLGLILESELEKAN
jgi:UDP-N-acetylglucosamine:LPS N-acetylglucosamine transferase